MTKENKTIQNQDKTPESKAKKHGGRSIIAAILCAAVLVIVAIVLFHKIYYADKWYRQTYINEVDVSGQTLEESKKNLEKKFSDYKLTVVGRNDSELVIDGDDIDFSLHMHEEMDGLFDKQHEHDRLFPKTRRWTQKFNVSYNVNKLKDMITDSELVQGSGEHTIINPKSAYITYSKEKQQFICQKEVVGNTIIPKNLVAAIEETMKQGNTTLDLTKDKYAAVYKSPKYTSDSKELTEELELYNGSALRYIVWNMGKGNIEQITPVEISKWITCKNGKVTYKNKKIENWVENFCLKYKTVGITRKIKSHTGKMVKIVGGDYGWQLDYEKMVQQTKKALKESIDVNATQAYIDNPNEDTKKGITLKRKAIYLNTAFQKDYENFTNDWDPKNYTEISISDQKVYVFRNGKVKFSCRCITGRPTEDRRTPTGAYFIKEHKEAYTLTGADYSTPVKNWVRITWTGTGFHPATWQPWSRWSKTLYLTRGSHGCINLSVSDAQKIYNMTKYREAVFIH